MKKSGFSKLINIIAVVLVFACSFYVGNLIAGVGAKDDVVKAGPSKNTEGGLPVDRLNVLLLGIDARPGEEEARTDTMILVSIDKETNKIAMLSIPRDTLVDIPGYGKSKINAANQIGGSELAVDVVEDMLGVEIPYYAKTNFDGFKDVVDTLGGVTIDVEKRMYYRDGKDVINLKKGEQRLDGEKALQYVRFRHDALGDISRTERQQKFLIALADEFLQAKTIVKIPKLLPQILGIVETNFGVKDVFFLTKVASFMKAENMVAQTLPGTFYNYKGASYWKANDDKLKLVLDDMFSGVTTAAVVDAPINVPKVQPKPPEEEPKPEPPKVDVKIGEEDKEQDDSQTQPEDGTTEPSDGTTEPSDGTTEPSDGTTQPSDGTTSPGDGTTTPTDGTTDPGTAPQPTQPGNGTTTPPADQQAPNSGTTSSTTTSSTTTSSTTTSGTTNT